MPNRIIREAILTSERVCSLGWADEVFYRRLMSIVDDYGRHEANPQLLRSKCYPLQTDAVRVADITRSMAACQKAGVIVLYEVLGKQYIEVSNFGQQQRSASKCPDPPAVASKCLQPPATEHLVVFEGVSEVEGVSASPPAAAPPTNGFDEFYAAYPRKVQRKDAAKAWEKLKPDAELQARILNAVEAQKKCPQWLKDGGQFIPYPATWLNGGEWENEVEVQFPPGVAISHETPWQRSQREKVHAMTGGIASAKAPGQDAPPPKEFIDVPAVCLG